MEEVEEEIGLKTSPSDYTLYYSGQTNDVFFDDYSFVNICGRTVNCGRLFSDFWFGDIWYDFLFGFYGCGPAFWHSRLTI